MQALKIKTITFTHHYSGKHVEQSTYKLTPPYEGNHYVVSSAINVWDGLADLDEELGISRNQETKVFPSNQDGDITSYYELCVIDEKNCDKAIESIGYTVVVDDG